MSDRKDNVTRIGAHKPKQAGNVMRKHELRARTQAQLDQVLSELEAYKQAHRNLCSILEGLVRIHGPQAIPIELLETHCRHGRINLGADESRKLVIIELQPEAAPEPQELPPMPPEAPKPSSLTLLREGQNFRDGKVVQEHAGFIAEAVDHLPEF